MFIHYPDGPLLNVILSILSFTVSIFVVLLNMVYNYYMLIIGLILKFTDQNSTYIKYPFYYRVEALLR